MTCRWGGTGLLSRLPFAKLLDLDRPPPVGYNGDMSRWGGTNVVAGGMEAASRPATQALAGLLCLWVLLACSGCSAAPVGIRVSLASPTPRVGAIQVESTPSGAAIWLDGEAHGETPKRLVLQPGRYALRLEKAGYAPATLEIEVQPGRDLAVSHPLLDSLPPRLRLGAIPSVVAAGHGLKLSATAEDGVGVVRMALSVDGELVCEVGESSLRHNLDTREFSPGRHWLVVEAQDAAGNLARERAAFDLLAPTVTPVTPSAQPSQAASSTPPSTPHPTVTMHPTAAPTHKPSSSSHRVTPWAPTPTVAHVTPAAAPPVSVSWGEVTISTYAYEQALYTDPEGAGHPYPLLHGTAWALPGRAPTGR